MTQTFRINNGDINFSVSGQLKMIADEPKVHQDVAEMLSIKELDGFGASLIDIIGKVDQVDFLRGAIYRQIVGGVNGLIRLQRGKQSGQRPGDERIDSIQMLQVIVSDSDPTSFIFQLQLKTVEAQILTTSGTVFPTLGV